MVVKSLIRDIKVCGCSYFAFVQLFPCTRQKEKLEINCVLFSTCAYIHGINILCTNISDILIITDVNFKINS